MSTVKRMERYFQIRGIADEISLIVDSQDIQATVIDTVGQKIAGDFNSFFVFARDGEILNIWGIETYVPRNNSYVEMIYSAAKFHRELRRKIARKAKR